MNKKLMTVTGCMALILGFAVAGETTTKKMPSLMEETKTCCASEKNMEFRIGPAFNVIDATTTKTGRRSQGFNLSDLGFDDVNYGLKTSFDWEFSNKWHWNSDFTWNHYDQSGTTEKDLTFGSGVQLVKGSRMKAEAEVYQLETRIGYDVFKNKSFSLTPYVGLSGVLVDAKVSTLSGSVKREQGKISVIDQTKVNTENSSFGNYLVGFETQYRIIQPVYVGFDFGGYYLDQYWGGVGKGYVGYDINETWTVRVGADSQYVNFDLKKIEGDGFSTTGYVQLGMKF